MTSKHPATSSSAEHQASAGLVLRTAVGLGLFGCTLVGCTQGVSRSAYEAMEADVAEAEVELEKQLQLLEDLTPRREEHQSTLARAASLKSLREDIELKKDAIRKAKSSLETITEDYDAYRREYQIKYGDWIRKHAKGTRLETLELTDGTTMKNVTVSSLTKTHLGVTHEAGITAIPIEKLPVPLQEKMGYFPELVAALERERAEKEKKEAPVGPQRIGFRYRVSSYLDDPEYKKTLQQKALLDAAIMKWEAEKAAVEAKIINLRERGNDALGGRMISWKTEKKRYEDRYRLIQRKIEALYREQKKNHIRQRMIRDTR